MIPHKEDWVCKKFYVPEDLPPISVVDIYGNETFKPQFKMTFGYINHIRTQQEKEEKMELEKLKQKLELEFQLYGEVDEVEYQRFLNLTKKQQQKLFVNKTKYYKG